METMTATAHHVGVAAHRAGYVQLDPTKRRFLLPSFPGQSSGHPLDLGTKKETVTANKSQNTRIL